MTRIFVHGYHAIASIWTVLLAILVTVPASAAFSSLSASPYTGRSTAASSSLQRHSGYNAARNDHRLYLQHSRPKTFESWNSIHRLRGGAGAGDGMTTTSLSARVVETGSSVLQTVWKHPFMQTMWAWTLMLWRTCLAEFQSLSTNQRRLMLAVFLVGIQLGRSLSSLSLKRFQEAVDIPSKYFGPTAPCLSGRVVSVSDGDTLRFYHVPTIFHKSSLKKKQKVSEWALPIRVCTIDTPETSKFGKPGQPFGEDAKKELQKLVDNRIIQVRLLTKDQYGRAVGQVFVPRRLSSLFRRQCVDEVLLQAGLAEVYQGAGAVYGPKGKEEYLKLEEEARKAKNGIWSQKKRESAAEYKRRTK